MKKHVTKLFAAVALSASVVTVVTADPDFGELDVARSLIQGSGIDFQEASKRIAASYPGQILEYELEEEDDRLVHEFELVNIENKTKYKIEIDALNGEVKEEKEELKSSLFKKDKDLKLAKRITPTTLTLDEAVAIVEQQLPEGSMAVLADVELEYDHGLLYFEVDTEDENGETEWLVDATTKMLIPTFKQD